MILAARTLRDAEPPWPAIDRREAGKRRLTALVERRRRERLTSRKLVASVRYGVGGLAPRSTFMRRARTATMTLSLTAAVAFAGTAGVAPVAASSLPGEPLYHVKRFGESAELLVTFDPERRVSLRTLHAQRRLDEMARLREAGSEIPDSLFESWLSGQAGVPNALAGLSTDQRRMLADLVDRLGRQADAESEAVLSELRAIRAAEANEAARLAEEEAASAAAKPPSYDWATRPLLRPLPQEPDPTADASKKTAAPAQPPSNPIVDKLVDDVPGAIQVTIPEEEDDRDEGAGNEAPAGGGQPGSTGPGAGGSEPPSGVAPPSGGGAPVGPPPPFVQPPPASEPPPSEPPGGAP